MTDDFGAFDLDVDPEPVEYVDLDADGAAEAVAFDLDEDDTADVLLVDTNDDGVADVAAFDLDEDGGDDDASQSLYHAPDEVTDQDLDEASDDLDAASAVNVGMGDFYRSLYY